MTIKAPLKALALTLLACASLAACKSPAPDPAPSNNDPNNDPNNEPNNDPNEGALTFFKDIKPLLDAKCNQCHFDGGPAPFALDDYEQVVMLRESIALSLESGLMPPWQPSEACNSFEGDFSMSAEQKSKLLEWLESPMNAGDPASAPEAVTPPSLNLPRVDLTITMPEAYKPRLSPDDYRCFVMDWQETEERFVTGFQAAPGNVAIVHHALAFAIPPDKVPTVEALDAAEEGVGYTCYGTPFGDLGVDNFPSLLGTWVPGTAAISFPKDTGIRIVPGSKIVIQMHYNTLSGNAQDDRSSIQFTLADSVEDEAVFLPFTNPEWLDGDGMLIPKGDSDVRHSFGFDVTRYVNFVSQDRIPAGAFMVHSAFLHMHTLGASTRISVMRQGGEDCMLDIPRWDFNWQATYTFTEPRRVDPGDAIFMECRWDNSAENQPFVNVDTDGDGAPDTFQQRESQDVRWGEGTTDEMCISFLYVTSAPR